jgi:hypothetical protein
MSDLCKYGSSGDTCGPLMEFDRCICKMDDENDLLRAGLRLIEIYARANEDESERMTMVKAIAHHTLTASVKPERDVGVEHGIRIVKETADRLASENMEQS